MGKDSIPPILENQLRKSKAVVHGIYKGSTIKKMNDGRMIIEYSFKILNSQGISNTNDFHIISKKNFWKGKIYNSSDIKIFYPGEELVLVLEKGKEGFQIIDQEVGKYKILRERGGIFLSLEELNLDRRFEKIPVEDFNQLIINKFGKPLFSEGSILESSNNLKEIKNPKRDISSLPSRYFPEEPIFLILSLGILGAVGIKLGRSL